MGYQHGFDTAGGFGGQMDGCGMPMGGYGCCDQGMGYGYAPVAAPVCGPSRGGFAGGFALILVLFILLVIIGAAWAA